MIYIKITEKKLKWINRFYDTIYDYYCSGHNTVYRWNLQHELKFLRYLKSSGEYSPVDAKFLNDISELYRYIIQYKDEKI